MDVHNLPTLNAFLNFIAGIWLLLGWLAIRRNDGRRHKECMIAALCSSALFLCSYLTYHYYVPGVTRYQGTGLSKAIYLAILISHSFLAAAIVPYCFAAVVFAVKKNFQAHTRITRWLLPVWGYVSVTGVVVYLMLYRF